MSGQGKFWENVQKKAKKVDLNPVSVGTVKSLKPLVILYNGLELSYANGDTIFVNNMMLDDVIEFTAAQKITCSNGTITENHTDLLNNEIEAWLVSIHNRYILHIGDFIAVQKLRNNTYVILDKLQKVGNGQ